MPDQTAEEILMQILAEQKITNQFLKDLSQPKTSTLITVQVQAGDLAVQQLVTTVLAEILKQVENENILHITAA